MLVFNKIYIIGRIVVVDNFEKYISWYAIVRLGIFNTWGEKLRRGEKWIKWFLFSRFSFLKETNSIINRVTGNVCNLVKINN